MKPPPFEYRAPASTEEAVEILAEAGPEASPLAGGQSLVPAMNFRLARPSLLVDLNGVEELSFVREDGDGGLRIGAMARQSAVERSAAVARRAPLVAEALAHVGHPQIRNRGTVGGSLAHADPAAELPAVLLALGGRCRLRGPEGDRWVAGEDFYLGAFGTAREPDELLVEVELPAPPERHGWAFEEMARRHGDFALAGVAVSLGVDAEGRVSRARMALIGVGPGPVLAEEAGGVLEGRALGELAPEDAAVVAADEIQPSGDVHASAEYRRRAARALARRAVIRAAERADSGEGPFP